MLLSDIQSLDVSFIPEARLQVKKCREALKYSYVVLFFMRKNKKQSQVMEYMQDNLEVAIEKLAQLLSRPVLQIEPPEVRKHTKVAQSARDGLFSVVGGIEIPEIKSD